MSDKKHATQQKKSSTKNPNRDAKQSKKQDLASSAPEKLWSIEDYGTDLQGAAAEKLYDSAVAPVVAKARGYRRIFDGDGFHDWATKVGLKKTQKMYLSVRNSVVGFDEEIGELDGLVMPWFSVKYISLLRSDQSTEGHEPELQLRPAKPANIGARSGSKKMKYIFAKNASMYLDVHPATPDSWMQKAPVVLFAEGLLKGDSAMTAHLIAHGADADLLTDTSDTAAQRLTTFMESLPLDSQVLILRSPSATTFYSDPVSLSQLNLTDRVMWMGFDADVDTNTMVWNEAYKLQRHLLNNQKARQVKLLSPTADDGGKDGIDDFLSHRGDWDTLTNPELGHLRDNLPEKPDIGGEFKPGDWRITEDFASTEELRVTQDEYGNNNMHWAPGPVEMGARIDYVEERRTPTHQELITGIPAGPSTSGDGEAFVGVEVSYRDGESVASHLVEGPIDILSMLPVEWRQTNSKIPPALARHPEWPPRGQHGERWLKAIKRASKDTEEVTEWTKMGWVPVEGELPAFIVGNTVTAWTHEAAAAVRPGLSTEDLHNIGSFGIGGRPEKPVIHPADDLAGWQKQARDDFNKVRELYLDSGAWTDLGVAAIVLLAALRPVVPVFEPVANPRSTLFIHGPAGGGKSMTAKHIMAFWAANGSDFNASLPGSAEDTRAAMEHAVSITPIWTIDDLAPSPSRRTAESQETAISDIIRSTFNASPKMRMTREMGTRKAAPPAAQLIITAENELSVPSAEQRAIRLRIGSGSLNPSTKVTNAIFDAAATGLQSRVTQHAIFGIYFSLSAFGWRGITEIFTEYYVEEQETIRKMLEDRGIPKGRLQRMSEVISDLTVVIPMLMTLESGIGFGDEWCQYLFSTPGGEWDDSKLLREAVVDYMVRDFDERKDTTPGRSFLSAIRLCLDMGQAHIESAEDSSRPPYVSGDFADDDAQDSDDNDDTQGTALDGTDTYINSKLGWQIDTDGNARRQGPTIGRLIRSNEYGEVIMLDSKAAFNVAERHHPGIILPGMKQGAAISSLWEEKLVPERMAHLRGSGTHSRNTIRIRGRGVGRVSGVPVDVQTILEAE